MTRLAQLTRIANFRWLATDEDDGKIVRELALNSTTQHLDKTTYNIQVKTGDVSQAGTDADVHIKIFGEKGDTDKIRLMKSENTTNKFERNQIDKFIYEFDDLGKVGVALPIEMCVSKHYFQIKSLVIGHNGKGIGDGWFLDWVEISIPMRGEVYR